MSQMQIMSPNAMFQNCTLRLRESKHRIILQRLYVYEGIIKTKHVHICARSGSSRITTSSERGPTPTPI